MMKLSLLFCFYWHFSVSQKGVLTDAKLLANQAKYSFVCMAISSTGGSSELSILMPAAMGVSAQASIVYLCPLTRPKFEDIMSGHAQSVIKKHFNICDIKEINISNAFKLVKAKSKNCNNCTLNFLLSRIVNLLKSRKLLAE